jgi:hypothetical protein
MSTLRKDTVVYTPTRLSTPRVLRAYKGPADGTEDWAVAPQHVGRDGVVVLWWWNEDRTRQSCAPYRVAWRWTQRKGDEGFVLVWAP